MAKHVICAGCLDMFPTDEIYDGLCGACKLKALSTPIEDAAREDTKHQDIMDRLAREENQ